MTGKEKDGRKECSVAKRNGNKKKVFCLKLTMKNRED